MVHAGYQNAFWRTMGAFDRANFDTQVLFLRSERF